jgi:hypothetical protein
MSISSVSRWRASFFQRVDLQPKQILALVLGCVLVGAGFYTYRLSVVAEDETLRLDREKRRNEVPRSVIAVAPNVAAVQTELQRFQMLTKNKAGDLLRNPWPKWFSLLGELVGQDAAIVEFRTEPLNSNTSIVVGNAIEASRSVLIKVQLEVRDDKALAALLQRFTHANVVKNLVLESTADGVRNSERFSSIRLSFEIDPAHDN